MKLEKEIKNIEIATNNIRKRLTYLYYEILKNNENFESKYLLLDCFDDLKNIEISNYFLERDFEDFKK